MGGKKRPTAKKTTTTTRQTKTTTRQTTSETKRPQPTGNKTQSMGRTPEKTLGTTAPSKQTTRSHLQSPLRTTIDQTTDAANTIAGKLDQAERSFTNHQANSEAQKKKFAQGIKSALNMIKKLNPKTQDQILKGKISVPTQASKELVAMNDMYINLIQQNSHASKSAKLKHILGISEKKDSKETTRRDTLTTCITCLDAILTAYEYFFAECLNKDKVLQPLKDNLKNIINKLGPNGKKYIKSHEELQSTKEWRKRITHHSTKLSREYRFNEMEDTTTKQKINFCDEQIPVTPYEKRARKVYTMCRDQAKDFKDRLSKTLSGLYGKFNFDNNSMSFILTDDEIIKAYNLLHAELQQFTDGLNEFDKIASNYPRIFEDPSINAQTNTIKQELDSIFNGLKHLSTQFTSDNVRSIMTTNDTQLNTRTNSLLSCTHDLFNSLTNLKTPLLNGDYLNAAKAQSTFIHRLNKATADLQTYQTYTGTIDNNSLSHLTPASITFRVDTITSKLKFYKKAFKENLQELRSIPENYALLNTTKALKLIDAALKGCSQALGPYANLLSLLLSFLGPIVGMKIASTYYANQS